jgi:hypothetical protein
MASNCNIKLIVEGSRLPIIFVTAFPEMKARQKHLRGAL